LCKLLLTGKDTLHKCWAPAKTIYFSSRSAVNIPGTLNNRDSHQIRAAQHALQQSKSTCNIMHPLQHSKSSGNVLHTLQQSCSSGNIVQVKFWADRWILIQSTEFSDYLLNIKRLNSVHFCGISQSFYLSLLYSNVTVFTVYFIYLSIWMNWYSELYQNQSRLLQSGITHKHISNCHHIK
jgi:hypothetical protein